MRSFCDIFLVISVDKFKVSFGMKTFYSLCRIPGCQFCYSDFRVSEAEVYDPYGSCDEDDDDDGDDEKRKQKPADGMSPLTTGAEDQIESEQAFDKQEEVELIPDEFYYDYEEHVSKAAVSDESGLPPNLMIL